MPTTGSTDALTKCFQLFKPGKRLRYRQQIGEGRHIAPTNPIMDDLTHTGTKNAEGPNTRPIILSEALVWAAVLAIAAPLGYEVRGVDLDADGILPQAVTAACEALKTAGE